MFHQLLNIKLMRADLASVCGACGLYLFCAFGDDQLASHQLISQEHERLNLPKLAQILIQLELAIIASSSPPLCRKWHWEVQTP